MFEQLQERHLKLFSFGHEVARLIDGSHSALIELSDNPLVCYDVSNYFAISRCHMLSYVAFLAISLELHQPSLLVAFPS